MMSVKTSFLAVAAFALSVTAQNLTINSLPSLVECQPVLVEWSGGQREPRSPPDHTSPLSYSISSFVLKLTNAQPLTSSPSFPVVNPVLLPCESSLRIHYEC